MLILSRYSNQTIVIGNNHITIKVLDVDNNGKVRIGIDAPRDVAVHRQEVFDRIQQEQQTGYDQQPSTNYNR